LDSARAYYNFTSQFGNSPSQPAAKFEGISTETALAAFMSTNKLIPYHGLSSIPHMQYSFNKKIRDNI